SGTLIFDKIGSQTISAAGALPNLVVQPGSITSIAALHILTGLNVNGALSVTPGSLDADAAVTVAAGATLTLGNASNTIGADLTVDGALSASGTIVFDGTAVAQLSSSAGLPSVQVAKTGSGQLRLVHDLTINGNLTEISGNFHVSANSLFTITV